MNISTGVHAPGSCPLSIQYSMTGMAPCAPMSGNVIISASTETKGLELAK